MPLACSSVMPKAPNIPGRYLIQKTGEVLTIKLFDRMIDRHTRELSRMLQRHITESGGNLRLLLALEARFPVSSPEALFESFQFIKLHADFIERVAVVGRREWQRTCSGLLGLFGGVTLQYFDQSEIREAVQWLLAEPSGPGNSVRVAPHKRSFLSAIKKLIPF
jgi:hypothetical protein